MRDIVACYIGLHVTRYELLDRIGVGGMAEIFRGKAVAAGGFEKPVAIKRILPHLSQDRRFVELLIAEAKVLSLLKHRNIVQIFDVGLGDDGQYFLVMEFVDGKDLGAVQRALETKRRRIPFDLVLHLGAEICEALEHAHTARSPEGKSMSLVHRDVSPSNVLLSRAGEVKLTDFGIAKRAEQDATQGGAVRGKFAYISPEQARNETLDPRSDVFSVGILMWELICNRRLFSGLDDMAALRAVREPQVQRPTEIDPRLPPEIDGLIMSALAKDKTRRHASAGQFGQKLRSLRYSLEATVGDPATELAKIIESTEEVERQSATVIPVKKPSSAGGFDFEPSEATVIRIRTADAFSARDNDASIVRAREVIDRFEEEETRLAQLSGDQMRMLRGDSSSRDSGEMTAAAPPINPRSRRPSAEPTRAQFPIDDDGPTATPPRPEVPANEHFSSEEATRLHRRTPPPQRIGPPTAPPPLPSRARGPTPGPPPGTVHDRSALPGMTSPKSIPNPSTKVPVPMAAMPLPPPQPSPPVAPAPYWGPPIAPHRPERAATPTAQESFDRPVYPQRPSMPQVSGFQKPAKSVLQPWMLIVGALIMAALAFAITRAFIR
ncbi:MAG: serine/threonine protein kinase [Myxococcales bacterium]|nr:serine/threonine protein kinase [Myxococcales bacterium]